MAEGKNQKYLVLYAIQAISLILLLNAVNSQIWYSGSVEVDYSEGLPAGSGMNLDIDVDKDSADGKIQIEGFLTYMQWQTTRNDTSIKLNETSERGEFGEITPLSEIQETLPLLIKISICFSVIIGLLFFFGVKGSSIIGILNSFLVLYIIFTLLILAPLGYIGDMDFTSGLSADDDVTSVVHQSFTGEPEISINPTLKLEYAFESGGYDLGLVYKDNITEVVDSPPGDDHESYFELEGVAGIEFGSFVTEFLFAGLFLFVIIPLSTSTYMWIRIDKPSTL